MGKTSVNLLVCAVAFPIVYLAALFASFAWSDAFVSNRTFMVSPGFIDGGTLLMWSFYFIFFFAVGIGLSALLRTNQPVVWVACFAIAISLCRLITSTHFLDSDAYLYATVAGEYVMPIFGSVIGALLGRRLRGNSPDK